MKAKYLKKSKTPVTLSKTISKAKVKQGKTKKLGSGHKKKTLIKKIGTQKLIRHSLENAKIDQGVAELLRIVEDHNTAKTDLFDTEGLPVFLTLSCFRIANVPRRILRFVLPHPTLQETSDVVLIVRDLEPRKRRPDNDAVVEMYEKRILAHGITHPIKVMPIRQVMTEFNTYEAKKQLCNQFDVVLADAHISNRLTPILGKAFSEKRKNPIPVKVESHQMKESIEKALTKSSLKLSADGSTFTVQVGHTKQQSSQIADNIVSVAEELSKQFPGGWPNIRNVIVKTAKSPGIPLYVSICNPNDINVVVTRPRLRHGAAVEGELSTAADSKVRVYPSGKIKKISGVEKAERKRKRVLLRKQKKIERKAAKKAAKQVKKGVQDASSSEEESEEEDDMSDDDLLSDDDEEMSDLDMEEEEDDRLGANATDSKTAVDSDDEKVEKYESDSEDPEADEAEEAYLNELSYAVDETKVEKEVSGGAQKKKAGGKPKNKKSKKSK